MSACALSSVVHLIGWMYLLSVPLSSLSVIPLLLAVGLCIDYCMHVAHEFWEGTGPPIDRALAALSARGVAVTNGGISTGISVSLLAFSGTAIMNTYFKMLVGVVVVGLWHALVLLPVALVALGAAAAEFPPTARQLMEERNGGIKDPTSSPNTPRRLRQSSASAPIPPSAVLATPPSSPSCTSARVPGTELSSYGVRVHPAIARSRASRGSAGHSTPPCNRSPSSLPPLGQLSGMGRGNPIGMAGRFSDAAMEADVILLREQMDKMAAQLDAAQARILSTSKPTPDAVPRTPDRAVTEEAELGV